MNKSINEILRNRDKEKKKNLTLIINGEKKYKDKYIQKSMLKKKITNNGKIPNIIIPNNIPSENKKISNDKNIKSQRNLKKNYSTIHYKYVSKRSQSIANFSNINNTNKLYCPLGPYGNILNGRGGFCSRISYNNSQKDFNKLNNNQQYNDYLNKFINKKNNNFIQKKDILSNFQQGKTKNIKFNNLGYKNKSKYKTNYINNVNKSKNKFYSNKKEKVDINEVNNNINYFKLNKKKNNFIIKVNNNINWYKHKKVNSFNEENNKICENEHFSYKILPKPNNKSIDKNLILIRQLNEQFSMNNYRIKTFNELCQIENILLNYYPSNNNINQNNLINSKSFLTNNSICSSQAELSIIKDPQSKISLNEKEKNKSMIINPVQIYNITQEKENILNDKAKN